MEYPRAKDTKERVWYVRDEDGLTDFIRRSAGDSRLYFGLQPRESPYKKNGKAHRTSSRYIDTVQNLAMHFVPSGEGSSPVDTDAITAFLDMDGDDYFRRIGVKPPLRTHNQGTLQLLFPMSPIKVQDCPDIALRMYQLGQDFQMHRGEKLSDLEVMVAQKRSLNQLIAMYGVHDPKYPDFQSRFYATERVEDSGLTNHLLSMHIDLEGQQEWDASNTRAGIERLLANDRDLRKTIATAVQEAMAK